MTRKRLFRPEKLVWRLGGNARTIHVQLGSQPDDHDPLIGLMDTAALAARVVDDHNQRLANGTKPG